jgi:hypothetical protein
VACFDPHRVDTKFRKNFEHFNKISQKYRRDFPQLNLSPVVMESIRFILMRIIENVYVYVNKGQIITLEPDPRHWARCYRQKYQFESGLPQA